jgi:hypothetical protein
LTQTGEVEKLKLKKIINKNNSKTSHPTTTPKGIAELEYKMKP